MEFKSQDIFRWDAEGRIGSKFIVLDESGEIFGTRLNTLAKLGVPDWCLRDLKIMRQLMQEQSVEYVDPKKLKKKLDGQKDKLLAEDEEICQFCGKVRKKIHPFFRGAVGPRCPECSEKNARAYVKEKWGFNFLWRHACFLH